MCTPIDFSPPTKATGIPSSSTSINVTWTSSNSNNTIQYFEVLYYPQNEAFKLKSLHVLHPTKSAELSNLKIYTFYVIIIRPFSRDSSDNGSMIIIRTLQDGNFDNILLKFNLHIFFILLHTAPSAPIIKEAIRDFPTTIFIAWDPPIQMNGKIKIYSVKYFNTKTSEHEASVHHTTHQALNITGLNSSMVYSVFVTVSTEVAEGPKSNIVTLQVGSSK